jgi:tetratricopeptide (TPR) repeat protein
MRASLRNVIVAGMVIAISWAWHTAGAAELANANKGGLYARSADQVLRYADPDIDIGTAALLFSERPGAQLDVRRYRQMLDNMAEAVLTRMQAKKVRADARAIPIINEYLFEELGYKAVDNADDPCNLFLDAVMNKKKGYCLSLSILYLAIGERIGLPVYGVVVPGHFFVRYDDGTRQFNIETTSNGNSTTDDYYLTKFKVPSQGYGGIYMRKLTNTETLSCFLNNLSNVHQAGGDIDAAMADLETAIRIAPGLGTVHSNLGNIYARKGWMDKAMYEYDMAIRLDPCEPKAYHNRAGAYATMGQRWDAIRDFDRAISLEPNFIDAYRGIADAYRQEKYYAEALVRLQKGRLYAPKDAGLITQTADVYRESGDAKTAIATYQQALRAKPGDMRSLFGLGLSYGQTENVDKEIEAYKQVVTAKFKPDEKEYKRLALFNIGNAYMNKKLYDSAIAAYQLALAMKTSDPLTLYNLAVANMYKKDYKAAVGWYDKTLAIEPDNKEARKSIAIALYNLKQYEPAWKHIQRARELGADVQEELYKFLAKKAGQSDNTR